MINKEKKVVAIVYHFFPHYRKAIIEELIKSKKHRYIFYGNRRDPQNTGILEAKFSNEGRFNRTSTFYLGKDFLFQSGLVSLALRKDVSAIIYLGAAHYLTTWLSAAIARITGKRVLFWTHGWIREESGIKSAIRCQFYKLANGLLLYGNRARTIGIKKGFSSDNLYVVYNSLDYSKQKIIRKKISQEIIKKTRIELFGDTEKPMLICMSRLIKVRGLDMLLESISILTKMKHEVHLLLVGDGTERIKLESLAKKYALSVRFYGPCYQEEKLAKLIMSANLTVAPGKIGLTCMHSLAYGTPVVTHDNPEEQMPEWEAIEPGKNGILFRHGDKDDLARVIMNNTQSALPDEKRRHLCFEIVDKYYNAEYQSSIIDKAVSGAPSSPPVVHEKSNSIISTD